MMASTHLVLGALSFAGVSALTGQPAALPLHATTLGAAALGALLPDVDTPHSRAGMMVFPLARALEKRFGHRTITHSLLGTAIFAFIASPLLFFAPTQTLWGALLLGFFSHLLADAATKSGVPLLYPSPARYVFPGQEKHRIKTGSRGELVLLGACLALALLLVPVAQNGPRRLLHLAIGQLDGAVRDVEDWSGGAQIFARVDGYDVRRQKVVNGVYSVVGRRDDGALVVESTGAGQGAGYQLLKASGAELDRISPRRVVVYKGGPRHDQTRQIKVANLTLAALSRTLTDAVAALPPPAGGDLGNDLLSRFNYERGREELNIRFLHEVLLSGAGVCYPFPQEPQFAPRDSPAIGLKAVTFSGQNANFDFAQPRHLVGAGSRVALQSATLTVTLPRGANLPNLNFPLVRREIVCQNMRRQSDLRVRVGDLIRSGETLHATFAQTLESDPTPQERERERIADDARRELLVLERETQALRQSAPATWTQLAPSYAARRQSLRFQAQFQLPPPQTAPLPQGARAPFDAVVERIEWEPPTIATRKGEIAEHSARVSLVKVRQ